MHVVTPKRLHDFWKLHSDAESPLRFWLMVAERADWETPAEVTREYPYVSHVGKFAVFNIGGGKYRLIVDIHYNRGKVYVHRVLTHAEYDRGAWKDG